MDLLEYAEQTARLAKEDTTSAQAARAASKHAKGDILKVLGYLNTYGPHTADEIANGLRMSVLSVRPRATQGKSAGWIERTGNRRATGAGNEQHELRITDAGRAVLGLSPDKPVEQFQLSEPLPFDLPWDVT